MQLSNRLQSVANLVTKGQRVADIGCDHAYTSIYMMKQGIATNVIAMDVNKGPLEKAKVNIKSYGYQDCIETRRSDGAQKLVVGEVDAIVISGMGGALMIKILTDRMDILGSLREVVLQPQSEISLVRKFLHSQGYVITQEIFLKEDGKYYVAMKARNLHTMDREERERSEMQYETTYEEACFYSYGKQLLTEKHPVLYEFLQRETAMRESLIEQLSKNTGESSERRRCELMEELQILEEAKKYY